MDVIPADAAVRTAGVRRAALAIIAGVVAADQISKSLVLALHPVNAGWGWVTIRLVRNSGASGGIASGHTALVTLAAFAVTALAVVLALRARNRATALFLAAVLGGAAGNLTDRLLRAPGFGRGAVVDWIHFAGGGGSLDIADLAINIGVVGALIAVVVADRPRKAMATTEQPS
jgi:signal peptidase II